MTGFTQSIIVPTSPPRRSRPDPARLVHAWSFPLDRETRLRRLRFRAWHRGVREADLMIGGFFDAHGESWDEAGRLWFEALLEEQDVDIMAWALGTAAPPARFEGAMMGQLRKLDFIKHAGRS